MKKIAILLAATIAFAINSDAQNSKQGLSLSVGYAAEKLEFETFEHFNGRYDMSYTRKPDTYDTESVSVKLGFDF